MKKCKPGRPKKPRGGPRGKAKRGHISMSREQYVRLQAAADARGMTMAGLVETAWAAWALAEADTNNRAIDGRIESMGRAASIAGGNLLDHRTAEHNGDMCPDCVAERSGV
jgi:hypothetical protein